MQGISKQGNLIKKGEKPTLYQLYFLINFRKHKT